MNSKMKETFKKFAKGKSGTELTSKDAKAWFSAAKLLSATGKCKANDLDIAHSAVKGKVGSITSDKMELLVDKMKERYAADNKMDEDAARTKIIEELGNAEVSLTGTKPSKTGGVDRMTDPSQYGGTHKERFDKDGKGKGIAGREDRVENKGYVGEYKGDGTYDQAKK